MSNVRFKAVATKLMSMVAALALALCMAPAVPLVAPQEAQAATTQSADISTTEQALAARFVKGGADSSITNGTWSAAMGLALMGESGQADGAAIAANAQRASGAGQLGKYILALEAIGVDCSDLYEPLEAAISDGEPNVYDDVCILPVYTAHNRGTLTESADYTVAELAQRVAKNIQSDPHVGSQEQAQALLALAPFKSMAFEDASAFGFGDPAELEGLQEDIGLLIEQVTEAYDPSTGAFLYWGAPNVDATGWAAASLCAVGWGDIDPADCAAFLAGTVNAETGKVEHDSASWDEAMAASDALFGLAACNVLLSEGSGLFNAYSYKAGEEPAPEPQATWKKDSKGWWYDNGDGTYPKNAWQQIGGEWYHFDSKGYMQTGWLKSGGKWYWLKSSGAMATGWAKAGGKWYYLNSSGAMQTGWVKAGGKWYYMNSSGAMQTGWVKAGGKWYYMNSSGAMQTGWVKLSGKWYYLNSSGAMVTGTQKIGGKTYRFNSSGVWVS